MKVHLAKEAKAAAEAKSSVAQAKISKVSSEMKKKIHATVAKVMREVEGAFVRRVKEAQRLTMEVFCRSSNY